MAKHSKNPQIWLLDDGRLGHLKQSQALLNAMQRQSTTLQAMPMKTIPVQLTRWQQWLAPRILPGADRQLNNLPEGEPAVVVGAGSRCALYSRLIKRRYLQAFNIQILDPRTARQEFSVLIIPEHDQVDGDNVILMRGSLVDIPKSASDGEGLWPGDEGLKLAVLLAGNTNENQRLLRLTRQHLQTGNVQSVISLAPRTNSSLSDVIHKQWHGLNYRIIVPENGPERYYKLLNTAEQFWVAADSINQLSEVLTVRDTQLIWVDPDITKRHKKRWIDDLLCNGEVQLLENYRSQPALLEMTEVNPFWSQQLYEVADRVNIAIGVTKPGCN